MFLVLQFVCFAVLCAEWLCDENTDIFLDIALQHLQFVVPHIADLPSRYGVLGKYISCVAVCVLRCSVC